MISNSKSNFQLVNLGNESDWSPASFLQNASVPIWPAELDLVRLQEIARIAKPCGFAIEPNSVVVPSAMDSKSGAIKGLSSKSEQIFYDWADDGLAVNDILVSSHGALLLTPIMTDILFSSRFISLRCKDEKLALWLWAILNSSNGRSLLEQTFRVDAGTVHDRNRQRRVSTLIEAKIPKPPPENKIPFPALAKTHSELKHQLTISRDIRASWLKKVEITQTENWFSLTKTQDPSAWGELTPITDLVREVIAGRVIRRSVTEELKKPIPFVGFKFLRNSQLSEVDYVEDVEQPVGLPGDILIGFSFNQLFVFPLSFRCALGVGVFSLRLKELEQSEYLQSALRSQAVQEQLAFFQTGTVIGTIKKKDVEKLRIPEISNPLLSQTEIVEPLATRLDKILWN